MKAFIAAANWKLNKGPSETEEFFRTWKTLDGVHRKSSVVIFPPALCAGTVSQLAAGAHVQWGAQHAATEKQGAFTGENSMETLSKMGGTYVLIGHSERRQLYGETDILCAKKVNLAQSLGLTPMLCLGETLAERKAGKTNEVLGQQLGAGLSLVVQDKTLTIAYEPVWAIGTGAVAEPEQIREAHQFLREALQKLVSAKTGESTPLLYGGSVNAHNAKALSQIPNVDGFLVGGASLDPETFAQVAAARWL